jgi:hypothetical protein
MTLKRPRDPNQLAKLIIDIARGRNLTATPTPVRTPLRYRRLAGRAV